MKKNENPSMKMPTSEYVAYCNKCKKYVGEWRDNDLEAMADANAHNAIDAYKYDDVTIKKKMIGH